MKKSSLIRWCGAGAAALSLLGGELRADEAAPPVKKLLVVGDSITHHHPAAGLAWTGDWGMAASSEAKDYVHLVLAKLTESQGSAPELLVIAEGGGTLAGKMESAAKMTAFQADLAIIQMGENDHDATEAGFEKPYEQIIKAIRAGNPKAIVICTGTWAPPKGNHDKNAMIQEACRNLQATFADIGAINADPAARAGSENIFTSSGVNWHPGDVGQAGYAAAIWNALLHPDAAAAGLAGDAAPAPAAAPAQILAEEKWDGGAGLPWSPAPAPDPALHAVRLHGDAPGASALLEAPLPADALKGQWIAVDTRVKGEGIASGPDAAGGPQLALHFLNAEGKDEMVQTPLPGGTFDWKDVHWRLLVPDNVVGARIVLGLQNAPGTVWFGPIRLSTSAP